MLGWDEAFGNNYFLSFGLEHHFNEHATLRFDAYNVLGWIDGAYNKRLFTDNGFEGEYRGEAPSVGLTFRYTF